MSYDATVVGAGPNGLAAALELARSGHRVLVVEASDQIGGGARTEELTLPGFSHDVCSAIHPTAVASPFFNQIGLEVAWIHPQIPMSHPLPGGRAVGLYRSLEETANQLGPDRDRYLGMLGPLLERSGDCIEGVLGPPLAPGRLPKRPFLRLAVSGGLPAATVARRFTGEEARALYAGLAAHSIAPFSRLATGGVGLMFALTAHSHGWPLAERGSQAIVDALAARVVELGGVFETGRMVESADDVPGELLMLNVMPPSALRIAGSRISPAARRRLRVWRRGLGIFKLDWALDGPIPWSDPLSQQAGTVHLGGAYAEVAAAERAVARGEHPRRPFVILAQQSLFDPTRAPNGKHTAWAYCHVPNGSQRDMTREIESQVERFAPGFRDLILYRAARTAVQYEEYNPNMPGGDIGGGRFGPRKVLQLGDRRPYSLGGGVFLCSSATPPGAGVHGMCGYHAARAALDWVARTRPAAKEKRL